MKAKQQSAEDVSNLETDDYSTNCERLELGEAWMWCNECGAKLYSFDGNKDTSRRCPHPSQC